jgi:hypothetical protein
MPTTGEGYKSSSLASVPSRAHRVQPSRLLSETSDQAVIRKGTISLIQSLSEGHSFSDPASIRKGTISPIQPLSEGHDFSDQASIRKGTVSPIQSLSEGHGFNRADKRPKSTRL